MRFAAFLDKDGTLVEDVPYNVDPQQVRLMPGAIEGLQSLAAHGYRLFVISNQPGVALGYFQEEALIAVRERLRELLGAHGLKLEGFYYCPHHPRGSVPGYSGRCRCRKPAAGLIERAAAEHGLELGSSWMIGDTLDDVQAGRRAGCRTVLLVNGGENQWVLQRHRIPHVVTGNLEQAARTIICKGARHARRFVHREAIWLAS